jgi:hypothetical protein
MTGTLRVASKSMHLVTGSQRHDLTRRVVIIGAVPTVGRLGVSSRPSVDSAVSMFGHGADVIELDTVMDPDVERWAYYCAAVVDAAGHQPVAARVATSRDAHTALDAGVCMVSGGGVDDDEVLHRCANERITVILGAPDGLPMLTSRVRQAERLGVDHDRLAFDVATLGGPMVAGETLESGSMAVAVTTVDRGEATPEVIGAAAAAHLRGARVVRTRWPQSTRRVIGVLETVEAHR